MRILSKSIQAIAPDNTLGKTLRRSINSLWLSVFLVFLASFFWGTTGTVASFAPEVSSLAIGAFAVGGGGCLLCLNAWKRLRQDKTLLVAHKYAVLMGASAVVVYPLAFYSAMRLSGVAIGTMVSMASAPFFSKLIERVLHRHAIAWHWWVSFMFGACGMCMMSLSSHPSQSRLPIDTLSGIGLGLLAGLCYAIYAWVAKYLIGRGIHAKSAMASMFGLAACVLLPSLVWTGSALWANATHISVALYMAAGPMFLGYLCFGFALKYMPASQATMMTLSEPIIATGFAVIIVGERFTGIGLVGMACVSVCLVLQVFPESVLARSRVLHRIMPAKPFT